MNNYFSLTEEQQRNVITQTGNKIGLPDRAVEKDLWVTTMLQFVFTLPYADKLVFKGGTSLSKVWRLIERFSEDIDLAIDPACMGVEGELTVKKLKKLRKVSSSFVKERFLHDLENVIASHGLQDICRIEAEPDGEGDKVYPEPRKLYIYYRSLLSGEEDKYLHPAVVLEIGARSLIEPASSHKIKSLITESFDINASVVDPDITVAVKEKTFLEKAFLLHELFSVGNPNITDARRRSRHLYDLEKMMDMDFAIQAISDNELWNTIHRHREVFTKMKDVDYSPDIRKRICLIPPENVMKQWQQDYGIMQREMIYGKSLPFGELITRIEELQNRFRTTEWFKN